MTAFYTGTCDGCGCVAPLFRWPMRDTVQELCKQCIPAADEEAGAIGWVDNGTTYRAVPEGDGVWLKYLWFLGGWFKAGRVKVDADHPTAELLHDAPRFRPKR